MNFEFNCEMCNIKGNDDIFFEYVQDGFDNYCSNCWEYLKGEKYHGLSDDEVLETNGLSTELERLQKYKKILEINHNNKDEIGFDLYDYNMKRVNQLILKEIEN